MNKNHYALIFILFGIALLLAGFSSSETEQSVAQSSPPTNTQPVSATKEENSARQIDFALKDMNDQFRHISEWNGKILVLNFWATWCGPCRHEIPAFNDIQKKYAQHNVQFIGLAYDDKAAIERFTRVIPIDYPVLYGDDEVMELSMKYGNIQSILPYTLFVDPQGKVFHITEGALTQEATERILAKVL